MPGDNDRKPLEETTVTEVIMRAMDLLSEQESKHGPAEHCMVLIHHYDGESEWISGEHNIPRYSHRLGLLQSAISSFIKEDAEYED